MERIELSREQTQKALKTLEAILLKEKDDIVRDSTIQRFEYSYEAVWKFLMRFLYEKRGIELYSPKECFRAAFRTGLLSEEETELALKMTDARNQTVHAYKEELADAVYRDIKMLYQPILQKLFHRLEKEL